MLFAPGDAVSLGAGPGTGGCHRQAAPVAGQGGSRRSRAAPRRILLDAFEVCRYVARLWVIMPFGAACPCPVVGSCMAIAATGAPYGGYYGGGEIVSSAITPDRVGNNVAHAIS